MYGKKHKKCLKENVARVTEGICSINLVFPHEFHFVWDTRSEGCHFSREHLACH